MQEKERFLFKKYCNYKMYVSFYLQKNNMNMHRKSTLKYLCELVQYI